MFKVYVPYSDHLKSVAVLDDDLLWQQLHDMQGLLAVLCEFAPRSRFLAVKQWRGYEGFLLLYLRRMQVECQKRDLGSWSDEDRDNPYASAWGMLARAGKKLAPLAPRWIGGHWFLASNRSELIRLNPTHYAQRFPTTPMEMPFLFPQNTETFDYTISVSKQDSDLLEDHERVIPAPFVEHVRAKGLVW